MILPPWYALGRITTCMPEAGFVHRIRVSAPISGLAVGQPVRSSCIRFAASRPASGRVAVSTPGDLLLHIRSDDGAKLRGTAAQLMENWAAR